MSSATYLCRVCRERAEVFHRLGADLDFVCRTHATSAQEWLDIDAMGGRLLAATLAAAGYRARAVT
jgi:hypothetical protein